MKIKNIKVYGLQESIIRSGYAMQINEPADFDFYNVNPIKRDSLSEKSVNRAIRLAECKPGSGHDNFLKGIIVQFDLQYPEYFSPQLQRYHWIDIVSSQSKMHRITNRELTMEDFTPNTLSYGIDLINHLISEYNSNNMYPRIIYSNTKEIIEALSKDDLFNFIISNLPSGYLKWMGISTNYLQLKTIWNQRCKHKHKLKEWSVFGDFIKSLPMSNLIIGEKDEQKQKETNN